MRASHLSLVPTAHLPLSRPEPRPTQTQGAAAFLEGLEQVMKQAREIVGAADQPADLQAICAEFLSRNAEVGESLTKVSWLVFPRGGAGDELELQLEPFIGA